MVVNLSPRKLFKLCLTLNQFSLLQGQNFLQRFLMRLTVLFIYLRL